MSDPKLCRYHRSSLATLKDRLGTQHHGHRTAQRTLAQIAKQCPQCAKEKP